MAVWLENTHPRFLSWAPQRDPSKQRQQTEPAQSIRSRTVGSCLLTSILSSEVFILGIGRSNNATTHGRLNLLDQNYISTNEHVHCLHTNFLNKIRTQIESIILLFLLDIFPCGFYGTSLQRILGLLKLSSWVEPSLSRMDWLDVKSFPNLWCQEAEIFGAMRW